MVSRIQVKFFFKDSDVTATDFVPVFHRWIQEQRFENHLLIDIADYKHVPKGPHIMLISHEADFAIDFAEDRPGIVYTRKREWGENSSLESRVLSVLENALKVIEALHQDTDSQVNVHTFELKLLDRLNSPNTPEGYEAVAKNIQQALRELYDRKDLEISLKEQDKRRALSLIVKLGVPNHSEALIST